MGWIIYDGLYVDRLLLYKTLTPLIHRYFTNLNRSTLHLPAVFDGIPDTRQGSCCRQRLVSNPGLVI